MESTLISDSFQERILQHMDYDILFTVKQQLDNLISMVDKDFDGSFNDFDRLLSFNHGLSQVVSDVALHHIYPNKKKQA